MGTMQIRNREVPPDYATVFAMDNSCPITEVLRRSHGSYDA